MNRAASSPAVHTGPRSGVRQPAGEVADRGLPGARRRGSGCGWCRGRPSRGRAPGSPSPRTSESVGAVPGDPAAIVASVPGRGAVDAGQSVDERPHRLAPLVRRRRPHARPSRARRASSRPSRRHRSVEKYGLGEVEVRVLHHHGPPRQVVALVLLRDLVLRVDHERQLPLPGRRAGVQLISTICYLARLERGNGHRAYAHGVPGPRRPRRRSTVAGRGLLPRLRTLRADRDRLSRSREAGTENDVGCDRQDESGRPSSQKGRKARLSASSDSATSCPGVGHRR